MLNAFIADLMSATTGAAIARLLSISVAAMSTWISLVSSDQSGALPCESSQFRRAPTTITTSACPIANERAAAADCAWLSGSSPFAIDIGK